MREGVEGGQLLAQCEWWCCVATSIIIIVVNLIISGLIVKLLLNLIGEQIEHNLAKIANLMANLPFNCSNF